MHTSADAVISFDIMRGATKTQREMITLQVTTRIPSFSKYSLHIAQTPNEKWGLKIVQLLLETHPVSLLNIIQIHAQPLEFCVWKYSFQIFNIYQKVTTTLYWWRYSLMTEKCKNDNDLIKPMSFSGGLVLNRDVIWLSFWPPLMWSWIHLPVHFICCGEFLICAWH